jgi:hypothetical protein
MAAAMEVMGETVVATSGSSAPAVAPSEEAFDVHPDSPMAATTTTPTRILRMSRP